MFTLGCCGCGVGAGGGGANMVGMTGITGIGGRYALAGVGAAAVGCPGPCPGPDVIVERGE